MKAGPDSPGPADRVRPGSGEGSRAEWGFCCTVPGIVISGRFCPGDAAAV